MLRLVTEEHEELLLDVILVRSHLSQDKPLTSKVVRISQGMLLNLLPQEAIRMLRYLALTQGAEFMGLWPVDQLMAKPPQPDLDTSPTQEIPKMSGGYRGLGDLD